MKNNTLLLIVVFLLLFLSGLAAASFFKLDLLQLLTPATQTADPSLSPSPSVSEPVVTAPSTTSPTTIPTKTAAAEIMDLFMAKYNWQAGEATLTINHNDGQYASGGVREAAAMGGGMWFAAKVDGDWHLVWDGNGTVMCSDLVNYPDFPKTLIPECYDNNSGKMLQR